MTPPNVCVQCGKTIPPAFLAEHPDWRTCSGDCALAHRMQIEADIGAILSDPGDPVTIAWRRAEAEGDARYGAPSERRRRKRPRRPDRSPGRS